MTGLLRVGGVSMPFDEATDYVRVYTANTTRTWSYPAYDGYPGSPAETVELPDLLAASLLNAGQKPIVSYYAFEELLPEINKRLMVPELTGTLAEATPAMLEALADLFGVLDDHKVKHVGMTKLAKVLHRKRPDLIPLYDENIRRCYSDLGTKPVPVVKRRTRRDFCRAWLPVLRDDLVSQQESWQQLADLATEPKISPLRAMDMVGWKLGERPRKARRGA
ncbi:hypothetical protein D477_014291 [Arthrobacter crystallopoietes BAB-32]|uniref:Uncharacterized protein n=1 Tax=Arthrobacter crystallopoietes BAB-32 TaxID=1246476 RepID=N1V5N8_9MICC|nr:DUF6308 family protein [Arthrobacter crystallopoietes]EMY33578.1 hypothetical protein D477_014291 [Arthrobacter crystallopoietes BAB-32]